MKAPRQPFGFARDKRLASLAVAVSLLTAPIHQTLPGFAIPSANADQTDVRLDKHFAVLQRTDSRREAAIAEASIWELWQESEDDSAEELLAEAGQAMRHGDYLVALELCGALIDQSPDFAEAWNRRATLRYIMRDFDGSLEDIEEVLALEPRHFGALSGRGLVLMALDRDEEAIAAFEEALAVHPYLEGARVKRAALLSKLGEREI